MIYCSWCDTDRWLYRLATTVCIATALFYDVPCCFFFQAEDGIRDLVRSRGLGDVYKRQIMDGLTAIKQICATQADVNILVLTTYDTDADIMPALEAVSYTHLTLPTSDLV